MTAPDRRSTGIPEAAIAVVTARLGRLPDDVTDAILADVDTRDLVRFLAGVMAHMIRTTDGGTEWLQRYGIAVAEEVT